MLGDNICATHNVQTSSCGCGCSDHEEPQPQLPSCPTDGECESWLGMECVFWMGDPIPGTPIKKGTRMTEVVLYLLNRIKDLEDSILH